MPDFKLPPMPNAPPPVAGVRIPPPPPHLMADATRILNTMIPEMAPTSKVAGIGILTEHGWNAAVVVRAGKKVKIAGWLGQPDWGGSLTGAAAIRWEF